MKQQRPDNIVLIGMPGAGKSTIGVILAKRASLDFVDTDLLIQTGQKRTLQDIVDRDGYENLRQIEEEVLLGLRVSNSVIATGGSAVYSSKAMAHLRSGGITVFLQVARSLLESRIRDYATRGLAKRPDQSFSEMFQERLTLYAQYADITITTDGLTHEEVCCQIMDRTGRIRS
jgi:shikimate kinase